MPVRHSHSQKRRRYTCRNQTYLHQTYPYKSSKPVNRIQSGSSMLQSWIQQVDAARASHYGITILNHDYNLGMPELDDDEDNYIPLTGGLKDESNRDEIQRERIQRKNRENRDARVRNWNNVLPILINAMDSGRRTPCVTFPCQAVQREVLLIDWPSKISFPFFLTILNSF